MNPATKHFRALILGATLSLGLVAVTLGTPVAMAQADLGSISGTVTDATGAVVAKAGVTLTNNETGAVRTSVTNGNGSYSVAQLVPGTYTVAITAPGFATATGGVSVTVGSSNSFNAKLAVAGGQTVVQVQADNFAGVQLEKAEVATVIETEQIQNLPTLDRNPYSLVAFSGNLSSDPSIASPRGVGFNISGARSTSVDILLDGAENTDLYAVGIGQSVPMDATSEIRVVTSNSGAEYGRGSGAVNVSTKSGTNSMHGSVYEYNRISTFGSDGYYNNAIAGPGVTDKPRFVHNQFGYSLGGPIKKDKLFFFSSTEWTRIRSAQNEIAVVPTPQLIGLSSSNMQAFFSQYGTLAKGIVSGASYMGSDLVNAGLFKTDINTLAKTNPAILTTPLFQQAIYEAPADSGGGAPVNQWISFNRVDYTVSDKTSAFVRYIQESAVNPAGYINNSPYAGYDTGQTQYNHNLEISLSHAFSANLASATKLLGSRLNNAQPLGTAPVGPTLYVNGSTAVTVGGYDINLPGYSATSPGNALPFGGPQNFIEIGEDLAWGKGKNQFTLGGNFLYVKDNRAFGAYEEAVDGLVQSGTKGALLNFVSGGLGLLEVAINPNGAYPCVRNVATGNYNVTPSCEIQEPVSSPNFSRSNRYQDGAAYVNDSYKATHNLTLNAGLRWEIYGPQHSQKPEYDANFFMGTGDTYWDQLRNGQVLTRNNAPNGRLWNLNLTQFAPKVGFAWDVFGNGKTSVRGGYGISYERNFNNVTFNVIQNPPNYGVISFTPADNGNQNIPVSTNNFSTFGTGTGLKALPNVTLRAVDPKIKPAYANNWSLSVERQLNSNTTASVSYVGTRGIHNYSIANINRSFSGINYNGDADTAYNLSNRSNLQYSNINWRGADGDSYYNSLTGELKASNLLNTGITIRSNYTYSHSIDNTSTTFSEGGSNDDDLGYLDPFNHKLDRANSEFDQRQRITNAIFWEVPFAKNLTGAAKAIANDWTLATTFTAQTGISYTMFDCYFGVTTCPRASFVTAQSVKKTRNLVNMGPDTFSYKSFPNFYNNDTVDNNNVDTTAYNEQVNPIVDQYYGGDELNPADYVAGSDTPICAGPHNASCHFVTGMTGRNHFAGPGSWNEDAAVIKNVKFTSRYVLQFKGEFLNIYNHANTMLNLGGTNDVSYSTDVLAYKTGNRKTELSVHFAF